ncbi:MAG: ATP-grasp domain-containing protein [Salinivirgaceae bacterium]
MIILDEPFVSDLLLETLSNEQIPVIETPYFSKIKKGNGFSPVTCEQAVIELNTKEYPLLYSNSENAIHWVTKHLKHTTLPAKIELFKDKAKFRRLVQDLFPGFYFKELPFVDLENLALEKVPFPFIIKPSVGFFSLGVHKVNSPEEWPGVLLKLKADVEQNQQQYPIEVVNQSNFIIEQLITGDEYAFDAYFNDKGTPVVLGIYKHLFSSDADVSDRVYYTSKDIIEEQLEPFTRFLEEVGERAKLRNFPLHVEVRIEKGTVLPIEINPMRFGGWCTTADLTTKAFDFNPYIYFQQQLIPDWRVILADKADKNYCMVILDNSTGHPASTIESFDYEKLMERFEKPLDMRTNDWNKYPVFGIMFTETRQDNFEEIEWVLKSDLKDYVTLK